MNNTIANPFLTKLGRLIFTTAFSKMGLRRFAKPIFSADTSTVSGFRVNTPHHPISNSPSLPDPELELPEGVIDLPAFQNILKKELQRVPLQTNSSFVLQLNLIEKNCRFLTVKGRRMLVIDLLKMLKQTDFTDTVMAYGPSGKVWLLLSDLPETAAINQAKAVFNKTIAKIREELDVPKSLLELNMFVVDNEMPAIK